MKKVTVLFLVVFCSLVLVSESQVKANLPSNGDTPGKFSTNTSGVISARINVAISNDDELDPAVSQCGSSYLVVYERDGDIYGQLLNLDATLSGGAFQIFDGDNNAYDPDVACLWPGIFEQYFMVVWTYDWTGLSTDFDIYIQALTTAGAPSGSRGTVANSEYNEMVPAIACEVDDYTCLVVYEKEESGDTDIRGRRVHLTTFGLEMPETEFYTGDDNDHDDNPAVTWSMTLEEYMVVWQDWYTDGAPSVPYHDRIRTSTIYEDEQGTGYYDEVKLSQIYLNPYWETGNHDQKYPDVAFNPHLGRYLTSYFEERPTTNAAVGDLIAGNVHWGADDYETDVEQWMAVAFSGGPTGTSNSEDEFLAVNVEIRETNYYLEGTYIWKGELFDFAKNIPIDTSTNEFPINTTDVCGTPANGHYLVVWEQGQSSTGYNIYARLVGNGGFHSVYIPIVLK